MAMKSVSFAFQALEWEDGKVVIVYDYRTSFVKHMRKQVFWTPNQKRQGKGSMRERKTASSKNIITHL